MVMVYILKLETDKYYVGKTHNIEFCLEQHFNATGSIWTIKYKPICVLDIIMDCDEYDEDKYTRMYMDQYGIDNVRGGSFCEEILPITTHSMLEKMKKTAENKCDTCGQTGHFVENCTTLMFTTECPDDIDELLKMLGGFIQDKRIKEYIDMSNENMINTFIMLKAERNKWTKSEMEKHGAYYRTNGIGNHPNDVQQIAKAESIRATEQKKKNTEYLPIIEVMYKAIGVLNDKINGL